MRSLVKTLLVIIYLIIGASQAAEIKQIIELSDAARSWTVYQGQPLYVTSATNHYGIDNQNIFPLTIFDPAARISLSHSANYRLISVPPKQGEIKNGQRYSDYFILDDHNELLYTVNRGTDSDLKPLVAAISDKGVLALADPVKALIYFYHAGNLIAEGQLYEDDGDMSMERDVLMEWVGERCYILLERPGFNGGPAGKSLFISIDSNGRGQMTSYLPFTYLQDMVFQNQRFFISGYDNNATGKEIQPMIIELSAKGEVLWTNENFGYELKLSTNGVYLAVLSSHELIQLFNLGTKRVQQIRFDHNNKVCLGLSVNNSGDLAVIRVAADFFAKRNTHFTQIYFPLTKRNVDIQIDPRFPKLFQLQSDGDRFFIGTNYEWLEISQ